MYIVIPLENKDIPIMVLNESKLKYFFNEVWNPKNEPPYESIDAILTDYGVDCDGIPISRDCMVIERELNEIPE